VADLKLLSFKLCNVCNLTCADHPNQGGVAT